MQSPAHDSRMLDVPRTVERRRRGRALDVMGFPTPDHNTQHTHLPTPVTQRRKPGDKTAATTDSLHLPTPQTLPRKRKSAPADDEERDHTTSPPSPSGHTTFVLSHAPAESSEPASVVRRRPGLLFAQQMGFHMGSSAQPAIFGARLGPGIGMGGGLRGAHGHGNPFLDDAPYTGPYVRPSDPRSPGAETRYIPQLLRPDAQRSLSPHPRARPRKQAVRMLVPESPESSRAAQRRKQMMDEVDNPFLSKPGEVVRARPTSEDHPLVTYVFRGAKKVFANPFIPPNAPYAPADLDPDHPDYEAHPCPPPRLLWPTKDSPEPPRRRRSHDEMEDDSESDDEDFVAVEPRRGLLFTESMNASTGQSDVTPKAQSKRPRLTDSGL